MAEKENPSKETNPENATNVQSSFSLYDENFNYEDLGEIPRETIMNIYGDDFENLTFLLSEEEKKVKDYFNEIQNKLKEKYNTFKTKIKSHLKYVTNKITNSFNIENNNDINNTNIPSQNKEKEKSLLIQNYSKDYIKRIENIIDIQNQIMKSIKETTDIFFNFLEISNFLDK